jgi:protein SCO1/2
MCSLTLGRIGKALELLGDDVNRLSPLIITVDPARDTSESLGPALQKYHPSLIGLTGTNIQLQQAYKMYKQKPIAVEDDWQGDPVISHSSYIYLMDPQGNFQTLFPPILNAESMAKIMQKYIGQGA